MERTPIFPLGIFSMEFFNFQFQEACNGKADDLHVTACSSEHDLSKRKKSDIVFGVDVADLEKMNALIQCWKYTGLLSWLSVFKFILIFVSKPKAKPKSTHIF